LLLGSFPCRPHPARSGPAHLNLFLQGAAASDARTLIAGAIISALATLMLAFFLGWKGVKSSAGATSATAGPIKY
jgi:hypothetical protein